MGHREDRFILEGPIGTKPVEWAELSEEEKEHRRTADKLEREMELQGKTKTQRLEMDNNKLAASEARRQEYKAEQAILEFKRQLEKAVEQREVAKQEERKAERKRVTEEKQEKEAKLIEKYRLEGERMNAAHEEATRRLKEAKEAQEKAAKNILKEKTNTPVAAAARVDAENLKSKVAGEDRCRCEVKI